MVKGHSVFQYTFAMGFALFAMLFMMTDKGYAEENFLIFPGGASETAIEEQVGEYLQREKNWTINYRKFKNNQNDVRLVIHFNIDGVPNITVNVDSLVWVRNKTTKEITGRKIYVRAYRRNKEDGGMWTNKKNQLLNALNAWNLKKSYFCTGAVDKDGDLILETYIPIYSNSAPVHIKNVEEVIDNTIRFWIEFHKQLKKDGLM